MLQPVEMHRLPVAMSKLYDADFYTWAMDQADAARRRSANEMDWDNLAEELETLGRSEKRELYSRYVILLHHLLKWRYQPKRRSRSWEVSIRNARDDLDRHMRDNPGLKPFEPEEFSSAYRKARRNAAFEMKIDENDIPETSPFLIEQVRNEDFWPDAKP